VISSRSVSTASVSREDQRALTETLLREASEEVGARREDVLREAIVQGAAMARSLALRYDGGVERDAQRATPVAAERTGGTVDE